jgi:hypothetical protein
MAGSHLPPAAAERPSPTVPHRSAPGLPNGPRRSWARSRTWLVVALVVLAILVLIVTLLLRSGGDGPTGSEVDPAAVARPAATLPPAAPDAASDDAVGSAPADEQPTAAVDRHAVDAAERANEGASATGSRSDAEADRTAPTFDDPGPVAPMTEPTPPATPDGSIDASGGTSPDDAGSVPFDDGSVPFPVVAGERSLVVSGIQRFRLDARADQVLGVTADDPDGGAFSLALHDGPDSLRALAGRGPLDADGARSDLSWAGHELEELWFWFEHDGTYELLIDAAGQGSGEPFTVQLRDVVAPPRTVVDVTGRLPTEGALPTFEFDGQAGQLAVVELSAVPPPYFDALVRIYDADGALLGETIDGGDGLDARLDVRLRHPGGHLVEADSFQTEGSPWGPGAEYRLTVRLVEFG